MLSIRINLVPLLPFINQNFDRIRNQNFFPNSCQNLKAVQHIYSVCCSTGYHGSGSHLMFTIIEVTGNNLLALWTVSQSTAGNSLKLLPKSVLSYSSGAILLKEKMIKIVFCIYGKIYLVLILYFNKNLFLRAREGITLPVYQELLPPINTNTA